MLGYDNGLCLIISILVNPNRRIIMKLKIDKESDALYFRLDDVEIIESEEVQPGIILDFDENGRVIGIEILSLSKRFSPEDLRVIQFETV